MVLGSCDCWEWGYCSGIFVWLKSKQSSYDDSHEARQPIAFVLTITLPLMYFVVTLFFFHLIYDLYVEMSAACFQSSARKKRNHMSLLDLLLRLQMPKLHTPSYALEQDESRFFSFVCIVFTCIHLCCFCSLAYHLNFSRHQLISNWWFCQHIYSLMGFYGVGAVDLSPAFSWVPKLLIGAAVCCTSSPW